MPHVIHIRDDNANGKELELAHAAMASWRDRGLTVAPVPADGLEHPYGKPCPACSAPALILTPGEQREISQDLQASLLEAATGLARAAGQLDALDAADEAEPMIPQVREALLRNDIVASRISQLTLLLGEITRRTVSPLRRKPSAPPAHGKWSAADQVNSELEKHQVNGLIESWSRAVPHHSSGGWLVRMSNGQIAALASTHQATLFCWGLESAHQAHREQDHDVDGQQWAYECGRAGMWPSEFHRRRGIRDKYGAEALDRALAGNLTPEETERFSKRGKRS